MEIVNTRGVLRLWRDVIGYRTGDGEYLVISSEAGVKGERYTIYSGDGTQQPIPVRVIDSRPTLVGGSLRHQLRLAPVGTARTGHNELEGR